MKFHALYRRHSSPSALFCDREPLPITLVQKVARPCFSASASAENYSRNLQPPFFSTCPRIPRSATYTHRVSSSAYWGGKWKWILKRYSTLYSGVPRRGFLNNRAVSLGIAQGVLSRSSRATALCSTFYGRQESYRPMVKCLQSLT